MRPAFSIILASALSHVGQLQGFQWCHHHLGAEETLSLLFHRERALGSGGEHCLPISNRNISCGKDPFHAQQEDAHN
jgi:hypothetical protein